MAIVRSKLPDEENGFEDPSTERSLAIGHAIALASSVRSTEAFVRVRPNDENDRFVGRFLALMLSGVTCELVGEVVATGPSVSGIHVGDRVVVPATVRRSRVPNPRPDGPEGPDKTRILRIPSADRVLMKVPEDLRNAPEDQILFLYRKRLDWLDLE